jgi:hypothetical protein
MTGLAATWPRRTGARPVFDLAEVLRLGCLPFAAAEAGYEALYGACPLQYQARDWHTHHYDLTWIEGIGWPLRGPVPDLLPARRYFVVAGGGRSFGARADRPFGHRISDATGLPCLNLSRGGMTGRLLAALWPGLLAPWAEAAAFVILEAADPAGEAEDAAADAALAAIAATLSCPGLVLRFCPAGDRRASAPGDPVVRVPRVPPGRSRAINRFNGAGALFRTGTAGGGFAAIGPDQGWYPTDADHETAASALLTALARRRAAAA